MSSEPAVTPIRFRRDVNLFLWTIAVFFIALTAVLLLFLRDTVHSAEEAVLRRQNAAATTAAERFSASAPDDPARAGDLLTLLRGRYGIAGIRLRTRSGEVTSGSATASPDTIRRSVTGGTMLFTFDDEEMTAPGRRYAATAIVAMSAACLAAILIALYVPKITQPIERMMVHARDIESPRTHGDETEYLIETFKHSYETMRDQRAELQRLHDEQKRRADDLAIVTATLTRSITSGFISIDANARLVDINGAGREILGLDAAASVTGTPLGEALGDTPFARRIRESFDANAARNREEIVHGARILGLTTVPLFADGGESFGMLVLFTDLTEIRHYEERFRQLASLAELGEISAGIAHEFRNSLATILGFLRLAGRAAAEAPEIGTRLKKAEEEAMLLSRSVDALLAFGRPMRLDRQPVDLLPLVQEVVERLADSLAGIQVIIEGPDAVIEGDSALLARALENVIRNAADSVHAKGGGEPLVRIVIAGTPRPSIAIEDNGVGIEPARLPRLFLPFETDKPGGAGLGLALTRKIVLLHGGDIAIDGEPGRGAVVRIELPRRAAMP